MSFRSKFSAEWPLENLSTLFLWVWQPLTACGHFSCNKAPSSKLQAPSSDQYATSTATFSPQFQCPLRECHLAAYRACQNWHMYKSKTPHDTHRCFQPQICPGRNRQLPRIASLTAIAKPGKLAQTAINSWGSPY